MLRAAASIARRSPISASAADDRGPRAAECRRHDDHVALQRQRAERAGDRRTGSTIERVRLAAERGPDQVDDAARRSRRRSAPRRRSRPRPGSARRRCRRRSPAAIIHIVCSVPIDRAGEQRAEDEPEEAEHDPEDAIAGKAGEQAAKQQNDRCRRLERRGKHSRRLYDDACPRIAQPTPDRRGRPASSPTVARPRAVRLVRAAQSDPAEIWAGLARRRLGLRRRSSRSRGAALRAARDRVARVPRTAAPTAVSRRRSPPSSPATRSATSRRSGSIASEPAKAALRARGACRSAPALTALAIENMFYTLSVAAMIARVDDRAARQLRSAARRAACRHGSPSPRSAAIFRRRRVAAVAPAGARQPDAVGRSCRRAPSAARIARSSSDLERADLHVRDAAAAGAVAGRRRGDRFHVLGVLEVYVTWWLIGRAAAAADGVHPRRRATA